MTLVTSLPVHEVAGDLIQRCDVFLGGGGLQHHLLDLGTERIPLFAMPVCV